MQDVHPIGGISGAGVGGGRVFGDRRLRPHTHHLNQQALKCPRCDSLNTKFCYYNNYNLSQPRHFCKNCRRYWTKGGVLRNVPVGGGCRKSKRSKPKQPSSATAVRKLPNSLSSSDSSATNATPTAASSAGLFQISESESFGINVGSLEPLMESGHNNHNLQIEDQTMLFSSLEMGGFVNDFLMNNSGDPLGLVGGAAAAFGQFDAQWDDERVHGVRVLDPTVRMDDLLGNRGSNSGLVALDCQAGSESGTSGLFDLLPNSSEVDDQSYWSQMTSSKSHLDHPQWSDHTNSHLPLCSSLPFF